MTGPPPPPAMEATMEAMEAAATERFRRLFVCLFVNSIPEKRPGPETHAVDVADPADGQRPGWVVGFGLDGFFTRTRV